jgi:hypothetical protein
MGTHLISIGSSSADERALGATAKCTNALMSCTELSGSVTNGLHACPASSPHCEICEFSGVKRFRRRNKCATLCHGARRLFPAEPGSSATGKSSIDDARYDIRTRND